MPDEREPSWSPALELAEEWASAMSMPTHRGEFEDRGSKAPLLFVTRGTHDVYVRGQGACIIVFLVVTFSDEAKARLQRLRRPVQRRAISGLRLHLLAHARNSFSLSPEGVREAEHLNRLVVEQLIRVSRDDPASFNRFADAIQEVVAGTARAMAFLGTLVEETDHGPDRGKGPTTPSGMYA